MFGFLKMAVCAAAFCLLAAAPITAQPAWVTNPHATLNRQAYVAAVGAGNSLHAAEMDALRALVSVFGMNVQSVVEITMLYREAVTGGAQSGRSRPIFAAPLKRRSVWTTSWVPKSAKAGWTAGARISCWRF